MTRTRLSSTELTILKAIANGKSSKEAATLIDRSLGTVEANVRALFAKFDARSRAHLVGLGFRYQFITCEDISLDDLSQNA